MLPDVDYDRFRTGAGRVVGRRDDMINSFLSIRLWRPFRYLKIYFLLLSVLFRLSLILLIS